MAKIISELLKEGLNMLNCMVHGFRYSLGGVLGQFPIYIGKYLYP